MAEVACKPSAIIRCYQEARSTILERAGWYEEGRMLQGRAIERCR